MSASSFAYPPAELANYVGRLKSDRPEAEYDEIGRAARRFVLGMLPDGLDLRGATILDFGCGAGRVIRHFDGEAAVGEVWGCDIDRPSIEWAEQHLSPPFHFRLTGVLPPLPFPDSHFDLIYAISVYTHLTDSWSQWILEMHRILKPGGMLVVSFLGRGMSMAIARIPWEEDRIGMLPVKIGTPWSEGGPCVLHSPWWLRAHFGRAFEVTKVAPDGTALTRIVAEQEAGMSSGPGSEQDDSPGDGGHGMIALRKDDRSAPTRAQLEAPEPSEPREFEALRFAAHHLAEEAEMWRAKHDAKRSRAQQRRHDAAPSTARGSGSVASPSSSTAGERNGSHDGAVRTSGRGGSAGATRPVGAMKKLAPKAVAQTTDVPERFDPETMRGEIIAAEHLARYRWVAPLAYGRRVLDAGCGTAYGSRLLAEAGATEVIGVDRAEEILGQVRSSMPENVTLVAGDVGDLEFEEDRFDLVVCFEVIEHLQEPGPALDEFRRVLAAGGLLAISSPNRGVYPDGNPHHLHEYAPRELHEALSERFASVRLERQHSWIASMVLDDERFGLGADAEIGPDLSVRKLISGSPGKETYTLALAGTGELPEGAIAVELASPVEVRRWNELWHEQDAILHEQETMLREQTQTLRDQDSQLREQAEMLREQTETLHEQETMLREQAQTLRDQDSQLREQAVTLEAQASHLSEQERQLHLRVREGHELRTQLSESEAELAQLPGLEARVDELVWINQELLDRGVDEAKIEAEIEGLREALRVTSDRYTVLVQSRSWRLTRPLRSVGGVARKLRR